MSTRGGFTNNTILAEVAGHLGAMTVRVHFRRRLTESQLRGLKDVDGVTGITMDEDAYGGPGMHYAAIVSVASAYVAADLVRPIVQVVADALGIAPGDVDLRLGRNGTKAAPMPAPRNPHYVGAATADDVSPGAGLMVVKWGNYPSDTGGMFTGAGSVGIYTVMGPPVASSGFPGRAAPLQSVMNPLVYYTLHLSDLGIEPWEGGRWSRDSLAIINTASNRHKLVRWLLGLNNPDATASARKIVAEYQGDYTVAASRAGDALEIVPS